MRRLIESVITWDTAQLAFFLFVAVGGVFVFAATPSLLPSALVSLLAYFIFNPFIDSLERRNVSRTGAIVALFLVIGTALVMGLNSLVPKVTSELQSAQRGSGIGQLTQRLHEQERRILGSHPLFRDARLSEKGVDWIQKSMNKLWNLAPNLASQLLLALFLVPFLTFVLLRDGREIQRGLLKLVPNRHFETAYSLIYRILDEMGGFVAARIIEAGIVTGLVTVGCLAADIPYAILLGLFAGATNPIPYLGPLLGAAPAIALAILEPSVPNQLVWVVAIYSSANLIDMVLVFPLVVARIVNLHPVVVVISVILGSQLFGIVGMIVAVPLTSILKILIQEVYTRVYHETEEFR